MARAGGQRIGEIQRRRLTAAAAALVSEQGAAALTVSTVLRRAGVSRRTFYELFANREEVVLAALEEALAAASAVAAPAWDAPGSWLERVRAAMVELLCFCDEHPVPARLLVVESLAAGRAAMERRVQVLARLAATVDQGREGAAAAGSATGSGSGARSRAGRGPLPATLAEGLVGGVLGILHTRLLREDSEPLVGLAGQLTGMIVLPYLGAAAARREVERALEERPARVNADGDVGAGAAGNGPGGSGRGYAGELGALPIRLTQRTVSVLETIGASPGASNRAVGAAAEVFDQGQISKLLRRLEGHGLIENGKRDGSMRGEPNAWRLTASGAAIVGVVRGAG